MKTLLFVLLAIVLRDRDPVDKEVTTRPAPEYRIWAEPSISGPGFSDIHELEPILETDPEGIYEVVYTINAYGGLEYVSYRCDVDIELDPTRPPFYMDVSMRIERRDSRWLMLEKRVRNIVARYDGNIPYRGYDLDDDDVCIAWPVCVPTITWRTSLAILIENVMCLWKAASKPAS